MSGLADVIMANGKDAEKVAKSECPSEKWPGFSAKGLNVITLSTLLGILEDRPWEEYMIDLFPMITDANSDQGPWVFSIPDELIQRLSRLAPESILDVAKQWLKTEELAGYWTEKMTFAVLSDLRAIAKKSLESGTGLLLWNTL